MNDELMIRKLIEDYSDAVNQRDGAAISALWAQDGRWSVPEYEGLADVRGVNAIRSTWESELVTDGEGANRYGVGFYADRFVRQQDGWRFSERVWTTINRVLIPA